MQFLKCLGLPLCKVHASTLSLRIGRLEPDGRCKTHLLRHPEPTFPGRVPLDRDAVLHRYGATIPELRGSLKAAPRMFLRDASARLLYPLSLPAGLRRTRRQIGIETRTPKTRNSRRGERGGFVFNQQTRG